MRDHSGYRPEIFVAFLEQLLAQHHCSYRQASLGAGLDPGAVRRLLKTGARPSVDSCLALAHYFNVPPNTMLAKAGYPPRAYYDLSLADPNDFAPEVKAVAVELMRIADPEARHRVCEAVLRLVREMFTREAGAAS
jgi:transcriptional regulator with XRE-family HTH domain